MTLHRIQLVISARRSIREKRTKLLLTPHPTHAGHKLRHIGYGVINSQFHYAFASFALCLPVHIGVCRNALKRCLPAWMRDWLGAAAIHWAQPNLVSIGIDERPGIELQHIMFVAAIGPCIQQPHQSVARQPKEHLAVEQPIPCLWGQPILQASAQAPIIHGELVAHHRAAESRPA